MRGLRRACRAKSSGQLLIVAALAIAVLVSSTTVYVYELGKEPYTADPSSTDELVLAVKQSARNALISALANVSNGGSGAVLQTDLDELSRTLRSLSDSAIWNLISRPVNDSGYDSGIRLSWNAEGAGVSSAYADFTLSIDGSGTNVTVNFAANVTTAVTVEGSYQLLSNSDKLVSLTCKTFNEGKAALARSIALSYEDSGSWITVNASNNLSIIDGGDGIYDVSFIVSTGANAVPVSTYVQDMRDILVQVNATCIQA